jgi:anti-anti-sigma factor
MTRHLTHSTASQGTSTASQIAQTQSDHAHLVSDLTGAGGADANVSVAARSRPSLTLVRTPVWRHRLILTGKLDSRSACELEDEVECLCQEGVTIITLDLRQLDAIDPTGATTIAFCGAICRRRGRELAVIAGSPVIRRALSEAGAADLLALDREEAVVHGHSNGLSPDRSTTTIGRF